MIPSQHFTTMDVTGVRSVCPLCQGSHDQKSYFTSGYAPMTIRSHVPVENKLYESNFRYCPACDLGYFYPLPDDAFFSAFYGIENIENTPEAEALIATVSQKRRKNWTDKLAAEVLDFISAHDIDIEKIRQSRSVDVGSGAGDFIGYANAVGYHVEAIEPVLANCRFIEKNYNTKAFCGMLDDVPTSEHGQFSLVYSSHSLEHHKSPLKTLHKFYDLLHEGGVLFISVPNLNSFAFQQLPLQHPYFAFPAHVNYFSATSMRNALSKLGFINIDVITTTNPGQMMYCWDAAIKLGYINLTHDFYDQLRIKGQHENLFVYAVKGEMK